MKKENFMLHIDGFHSHHKFGESGSRSRISVYVGMPLSFSEIPTVLDHISRVRVSDGPMVIVLASVNSPVFAR